KLELADKAIGAITVERDEAIADGRSLQEKLRTVSSEYLAQAAFAPSSKVL
ncbi:hypothetical protein OC842_007860, partial [Tilletia horrida]